MAGRYLSSKLLDDFSGGLGNWSTFVAGAPLVILSGALANDGVNGRCGSYYNASTLGAAVEASFTMNSLTGSLNEIDILLRSSTTSSATASCYYFQFGISGTNNCAINYLLNGVFQATVVQVNQTLATGDLLSASAVGTRLEMWRLPSGGSWTLICGGDDSNLTAAGNVGVEITNFTAGQGVQADNFTAGGVIVPGGPVERLQAVSRASSF